MTKILVIEDEAILRGEVVEWLTFEGYEAIGAEDGLVGIETALRILPDLIVSDITMPRLDGYGVLLEMHANPTTAHIPFILVTARASHEDIRQGMALGADDYITKPFSRLELLQAVQIRLEKKAAQQRHYEQQVEQLQAALAQEHQQRLLKAKLVAMFTHDFRNPISAIISSNSLVRDYADKLDEKRRLDHLNRIESSARQLMQLLDDMLVIAQIETDNLQFTPEPVNIKQFIQNIADEFQTTHSNTHEIVLDCDVSDTVMADRRLLRQIAANLTSNAIKYSPEHSTVTILVKSQDGQWMLSVRDPGIGIPEQDLPRLFQGFQRGSNVGKVSGTGLGLAIVEQAVKLHGGSIYLESEVNIGTSVTVTFPIH